MALMPVVGLLLTKVQPRTLIAVGLLIEAGILFHMSKFDTQIAFRNVMWARVIQAGGIAFLFVPVSTAAYTGLPPGKNNNASALINLSRNLGGSVGISLAQTWLARRDQFHQLRLTEHLTPYTPAYQHMIQRLQEEVPGGPIAALAALNQSLQQQVSMLSYNDVFYLLGWTSLLALPLLLLLRATPPGQTSVGH